MDCVHRTQQQGAWRELTEPFSMMRLSMTTPLLFCSHTISQKCPHVFGKGPCKHTRYTLYNTGHTNTTCSQPGTVLRFRQNGCQGCLLCGQSPSPTFHHMVKVTSAPQHRMSFGLGWWLRGSTGSYAGERRHRAGPLLCSGHSRPCFKTF